MQVESLVRGQVHCQEVIKGKHESLVQKQPEKSIKGVCMLAVFNQLSTLHCDLISFLNESTF